MGQLHLLFFTYVKRLRSRDSLDNRFEVRMAGVVTVLARFQRDHTDYQSSLQIWIDKRIRTVMSLKYSCEGANLPREVNTRMKKTAISR